VRRPVAQNGAKTQKSGAKNGAKKVWNLAFGYIVSR
jgi:hypothetical protein